MIKPTREELWENGEDEELYEIVQDKTVDSWRWGTVESTIYRRLSDDTLWEVLYRCGNDGDTNEFREGGASITQVEAYQETVTKYRIVK